MSTENTPTPETATYSEGELIAVRGAGSIALIDDRGSASDASFGLIAAASGGNASVISLAVTDAVDRLAGFGVAWQEDGRWQIALSGSVALTTDLPEATVTSAPKPGGVYRHTLGAVAARLDLHEVGTSNANQGVAELTGGAVRGRSVSVHLTGPSAAAAASPPAPAPAAVTPEPAPIAPEPKAAEPLVPSEPVSIAAVLPSTPVTPAAAPPTPAAAPPAPTPAPVAEAPPGAPPEPAPPSTQRIRLIELDDAPVEAAPLPVDEPAAEPAGDDVVQVLGIRCPADHHNHPDALYCSQCGRRMGVNQTAVARPGPRPPLGIFLIDDVATYSIANDFIIGREPESHPEVAQGLSSLKLDDESLSISRAHAAVRLDGWDVTAVDLGSSNGTLMRRAGSESWETVSSDTPTRLSAGDALRIGEREMQLELHHVQT